MASTNFVSQYNQWNNSTTQVRINSFIQFYHSKLPSADAMTSADHVDRSCAHLCCTSGLNWRASNKKPIYLLAFLQSPRILIQIPQLFCHLCDATTFLRKDVALKKFIALKFYLNFFSRFAVVTIKHFALSVPASTVSRFVGPFDHRQCRTVTDPVHLEYLKPIERLVR